MNEIDNQNDQSGPDFNDELVHYGLSEFAMRIRERIAQAKENKKLEKEQAAQMMPSDDLPEPPEGFFDDREIYDDNGVTDFSQFFLRTRQGEIKGCSYNVSLIFQYDNRWKGVFAYNLLTGEIDLIRDPIHPQMVIGEFDDSYLSMLHIWIEEHYGIVVQPLSLRNALIDESMKNQYHPIRDYLNQLPEWDGVERCKHWLKHALNPKNEPIEYLEAIGERFLIGAVRRIVNAPEATKVDNMLVFEGLQGDGKSTLVKELFSPWHGDTPLPLGNKDAYIGIRGKWGYEMAEMDSFNKSMNSTAKSFLSSEVDSYRPPFGTKNKDFPRQTVFIGSVNHSEYLTDSSGNRRYWPVWGDRVDVQWLRDNREQLWAEAYKLCKEGKKHWIDKHAEPELIEMVTYEQALREHPDAWEAVLFTWMESGRCKDQGYMSYEILTEVMEVDVKSINKSHEMKLSAAMQKLGWVRERKRVDGYKNQHGKPVAKPYLYIPPERVRVVGTQVGGEVSV